MKRLVAALVSVAMTVAPAAFAQNQLPAIQGPGGYQTAGPVVIIGYDSSTQAPCVIGKTATCQLSTSGSGGGGGTVTANQGTAGASPWPVSDGGGSLTVDTLQLPTTLGVKTSANSLSVAPSSDGTWPVVGSVASGATDSGAPVKFGCVNNSTLPTVTTGQRVDCQATTRGETFVALSLNGITPGVTSAADAAVSGANSLTVIGRNLAFNGSTWDRVRTVTDTTSSLTGLGMPASGAFARYQTTPTTYTDGQYGVNLMDTNGRLVTTGAGVINAANSTTTPLGSAGVFTGTSVDVSQYASITISAFADQAGTVNIQQSTDGTNWDITGDSYAVTASTVRPISTPVFARFARVVYTNGGVAQTTFRLQTILHTVQPWGSSVKPVDGISTENDTQQVMNFNMLKNSASTATADLQRSVEGSDGTGKGVAAVAATPNSSAGSAAQFTANAAVGSSLVAKASAGNLYAMNVTAGASALYIMVFDATSAPADGAVTPKWCLPLAANAGLDKVFNPPMRGATGLTIVASTTGCYSKTASATAFIAAQAQ